MQYQQYCVYHIIDKREYYLTNNWDVALNIARSMMDNSAYKGNDMLIRIVNMHNGSYYIPSKHAVAQLPNRNRQWIKQLVNRLGI